MTEACLAEMVLKVYRGRKVHQDLWDSLEPRESLEK